MTTIADHTAATADEIKIVHTPPTVQDAQLIMQAMSLMSQSGADYGFELLQAFETPPTLAQLRRKHPRDSDEYLQVQAFLSACEMIGTFVRHGLLNEVLVQDMFWIEGGWRLIEKLAKGTRKEAGEPRLFENAEWLAKREPIVTR